MGLFFVFCCLTAARSSRAALCTLLALSHATSHCAPCLGRCICARAPSNALIAPWSLYLFPCPLQFTHCACRQHTTLWRCDTPGRQLLPAGLLCFLTSWYILERFCTISNRFWTTLDRFGSTLQRFCSIFPNLIVCRPRGARRQPATLTPFGC